MGPEGPILVRVALVSDSYLVDLHLAAADLEFDFTPLRAVKNYRVTLGEATVKVNEQDRRYQTARIQLMYGPPRCHLWPSSPTSVWTVPNGLIR